MRLIHITDPHLSNLTGVRFSSLRGKRWSGYISWVKNRQKKYLPAILEQLTNAVIAENADQILLTGDLVQIGLKTEIAQAKQWLASLGAAGQVMLIPGNHDTYAKDSVDEVFNAWGNYLFQGHGNAGRGFPVVRDFGNLRLIGVSTACVTPIFMASGSLGSVQLEKLTEILQQCSDEGRLACLLIHHPPLPGMTKWRKALTDAKALKAVLQKNTPHLIFHGHLHHNRELVWGDTRIYCTSAASSASDASYRVVDIEDAEDHWTICSVLKSIALDEDENLSFVAVDEQSWQLMKQTV